MSIIEDVKNVAKLVQQFDNIEIYKNILNLQADIMALDGENRSLKKKVEELENKWNVQESLVVRDNSYWKQSGDGPFCVPCWDAKRILMRMTDNDGIYSCHTCHYEVMTSEARGNYS